MLCELIFNSLLCIHFMIDLIVTCSIISVICGCWTHHLHIVEGLKKLGYVSDDFAYSRSTFLSMLIKSNSRLDDTVRTSRQDHNVNHVINRRRLFVLLTLINVALLVWFNWLSVVFVNVIWILKIIVSEWRILDMLQPSDIEHRPDSFIGQLQMPIKPCLFSLSLLKFLLSLFDQFDCLTKTILLVLGVGVFVSLRSHSFDNTLTFLGRAVVLSQSICYVVLPIDS